MNSRPSDSCPSRYHLATTDINLSETGLTNGAKGMKLMTTCHGEYKTVLYRKKTIERPNGKNTKSKNFLKSVQNWCSELAHLKAQ